MSVAFPSFGETCAKEREDRQGGRASILLSSGDERSEPESLAAPSGAERETDGHREGAKAFYVPQNVLVYHTAKQNERKFRRTAT